jgi:CheY-like chemotaxis protein
MNRRTLQLVTSPRGTSASAQVPVLVIATTQPGLWLPHFVEQLGNTVFVEDTAEATLRTLAEHRGGLLMADYRALKDGWTGPRLARELAQRPDLKDVPVWLLAEHWTTQDEQLAAQCGAQGLLPRTLQSVRDKAFGPQPGAQALPPPSSTLSAADETWKHAVDRMFRGFVGPMGALMIKQTFQRQLAEERWSRERYADALANCVLNPSRRAEFLQALREQGCL